MPDTYLSAPSNLVDRPNYLLFHLILCVLFSLPHVYLVLVMVKSVIVCRWMYYCARRTVVRCNQTKRRTVLKTRTPMKRESDSSVSIVTMLRAGYWRQPRFDARWGRSYLPPQSRPNQLCCPSGPLPSRYQGFLLWE